MRKQYCAKEKVANLKQKAGNISEKMLKTAKNKEMTKVSPVVTRL